MSDSALDLKNRGNELFKATKFEEASGFYKKAENADPSDPVYPSNLSAALYETGDYQGSAEAILRAYKLLDASKSAKPDMIARLSTRLAKCLAHGLLSDHISDEFLAEHEDSITKLKNSSLKLSADVEKAWKLWDVVHRDDTGKEARERAVAEAMRNFLRLPQRRQTQEPYMEYFKVGTDEVFSLLDGWSHEEKYPLDLHTLPESRLSNIALLFGGVGDARHVFGTLISLHDTYESLPNPKKQALHVHMTMLDHHPAIHARDLCILMLLHQLTDDKLDETTRLEIEATAAYAYYALILPPYSAQRLTNVMEDLIYRLSESPPDLPEWLHVTTNSAAPIIKVLSMWLDVRRDPRPKDTTYIVRTLEYKSEPMEQAMERMDALAGMSKDSEFTQGWKARRRGRVAIEQYIDTCGAEDLAMMGVVGPNASPAEVEKARKDNREVLIRALAGLQDQLEEEKKPLEDAWLKKTKVFLPPRKLWSRHPEFAGLVEQLASSRQMQSVKVKQAEAHIRDNWKPNATLFYNEYFQPDHPGAFDDVARHPFSFADTSEKFLKTHESTHRPLNAVLTSDRQMVDIVATFFRAAGEALKVLGSHVKLEILNGSLNDEMSKMRLKGDSSRPETFPKSFVRMWLSNVPDYTSGMFTTAMHVLPSLEQSSEAGCAWNSFSATTAWKNADHYNHNYSLMTFKEVPKFFGLKVIRTTIIMGSMSVRRELLPRPLSTLASRQELHTWLTRALFQTLMPGKTMPPPNRVTLPNNVHAFVQMLIHLPSVGFPAHWIADYLQSILSGTVESDVVSYQGCYPIPLEERHKRVSMRKVRLDPWMLDFENAMAIVHQALPFAVTLPPNLSNSPSDIVLWKTKVVRDSMMDFMSQFLAPVHTPVDPVMNLLVFKGENTGKVVLKQHKAVFEGASKPAPGEYFMVTAIDMYDAKGKGEVRWRMSRKRVTKMKQEGDWYILPIRSDSFMPVADHVLVRKWIEVLE